MGATDRSVGERGFGAALLVAVLAVLAVACSSDSADDATAPTVDATTDTTSITADDPPDPETEPESEGAESGPPGRAALLDAGSEPRVTLTVAGEADTTISVSAVDDRSATVDGATTDESRSAEYDVAVEIVSGADGFELLVAPAVVTIDGPTPTADEIGTLRWYIDPNGLTQRVVPIRGPRTATRETLALFNVPNLVVTTPVEAVGAGARWSQPLETGVDATLLYTLNNVSDTDLDITIELEAPVEGGTLTIEVTGRYDRATLLARDVTAVSTLEFDSPVTADGEITSLQGVWRSERTYTEVAG